MFGKEKLSVAEFQSMLYGFEYKPGWFFDCTFNTMGQKDEHGHRTELVLRIQAETVDTGSLRPTVLTGWYAIPEGKYKRSEWLAWLWRQVQSLEQHEAQEWFKCHNALVYSPHMSPSDPEFVYQTVKRATAKHA